ncbi:Nuclear-interacting partner of ALK [Microtus ochrogaster]|uniref:Nuclear-interacting partner of ALK n=1 Tax=Microtus ochrogaster TaxID=79684 RepID=A0A8J6GDK1_MICOH|nr:Nuclear-interacting partner of ALK [Microtus ochrogaster]
MLPLGEPAVLVSEFLDRFQSLCHLELQLPSLRPEDLKTMCLTEDKISVLLHLLEDELDYQTDDRKTPSKMGSDMQVHVTACVLSLCGWACAEGRPEHFPLVPESPRRMMTRSQDSTVSPSSEQVLASSGAAVTAGWNLVVGFTLTLSSEKSPGPIVSRTRSWDSSSPVDRPEPEAASPTTRSRPVTRSMGTGDSAGLEVPSSPLRKAKRARLCSSGSSDTSPRSFFDPTSQHRDWCPWVNITLAKETKENGTAEVDASSPAEPGWKAVLAILLAHKHSNQPPEMDPMYKLAICMKRRPMPCGDEDRVRNSKPSSVRGLWSSKTSLKTEDETSASVAGLRAQCSESLARQCDNSVC